MAKQKLKLKKKKVPGLKPGEYERVLEETVKKVRNMVNIISSKMFEIGRVVCQQRKELPKGMWSQFYFDIAEKIELDISPGYVGDCVRFYEKYPDIEKRAKKTGLSVTHYERLSHLPKKEAKKFERRASEEKWTVKKLRQKAFPQKIKLETSRSLEYYHDFADNITGLETAMENLRKSGVKSLSQAQIDGMARSIYVLILNATPRFVKFLMKNNAKVDPRFKAYVKKFVR